MTRYSQYHCFPHSPQLCASASEPNSTSVHRRRHVGHNETALIIPTLSYSDLNLQYSLSSTGQHVDLVSRKKVQNRAQLQPTIGPKWAFGKALREARDKKDISQEDLAEAAGIDRSFVSLVERGIQSPNVVVLLKIAQVLGIPAAALVAETESKMRNVATKQTKSQRKTT